MHPKEILPEHIVQLFRAEAREAELQGALTHKQLSIIYQQGYLRIWIPRDMGGAEMPLPDSIRLLEALAWAEGSVGWVINLGAGANMFAGYMHPEAAYYFFNDEKAWAAGSGAISGTAMQQRGKYRLNGHWKYASGSVHATVFTLNAYLLDEEQEPMYDIEGKELFSSFAVPADRVQLIPSWQVMGLQATSSHDFKLNDVEVPEIYRFDLLHPSPYASGSLYQFPFLRFAEITTSVMLLGMAQHFLDEFKHLLIHKKPAGFDSVLGKIPAVVDALDHAQERFQEVRNRYFGTIEATWHLFVQTHRLEESDVGKIKKITNEAARVALKLVEQLYPFCGMTAIYIDHPLNHIWRDIHVASQHQLVSPLHVVDLGAELS